MKTTNFLSLAKAILLTFTMSATCWLTACSSDDDDKTPAPSVKLTEVGHDNSLAAHPGHELHVEASIVAEGTIKQINVIIAHTKSDFTVAQAFATGKYIGVKNTDFHEHIDIPASAPLGDYRFRFAVTDQLGQQTIAERPLTLVEGDDDHHDDHIHHDGE